MRSSTASKAAKANVVDSDSAAMDQILSEVARVVFAIFDPAFMECSVCLVSLKQQLGLTSLSDLDSSIHQIPTIASYKSKMKAIVSSFWGM